MKNFFLHRKWKKIIEESNLFDIKYYLFTYPDVRHKSIDPIMHYIKFGAKEGRNPNKDFKTSVYLERNPHVLESDHNPLVYYILKGKKEEESLENDLKALIESSKLFDNDYYKAQVNGLEKHHMHPIIHYLRYGAYEGRNPSHKFDTHHYLTSYKDIKELGINPLVHYIQHGKGEGRSPLPILIEKKNISETDSNIFDFIYTQNNEKSPDYIEFANMEPLNSNIRLIAFYLPQFHPIKENDSAWGKGFTEWTNVSKAVPQFEGHYQPRLPGELGYYDLRLKDIQKRQIELAKNYGLHGFCYHYYWFDGQKIMDTPLQQLLDNPDLDFPFCINWANENWTKRWDGLDHEVILKQNHSESDDFAFLEAIKPILTDKRYIKISGKSLLMVYRPQLFPDIKATVKRWREHARKIGVGELYLVLSHSFDHQDPTEIGFDAATEFAPNNFQVENKTSELNFYNSNYSGNAYDYKSAINFSIRQETPSYTKFRSVAPGWDNEARKPGKGTTFINASPDLYAKWLEFVLYDTYHNRQSDEKIVFINAWNEWAEGAYLEPDRKYGYSYLHHTYKQLEKFDTRRLSLFENTQTKTKSSDTAVILHLYYIDLWDEIKKELDNFQEPIDLYININNNASIEVVQNILDAYPSARIYSYENRGRDIYPFIQTLKVILPLKYKYACKIHSKKSLHRIDGDQWRNQLITSLIGSNETIFNAKKMLNKSSGIVVAKGNIYPFKEWIGSNKEMIKSFAKKSNINFSEEFTFPAGSMFWFKPNIMYKLAKYFDDSLLPFEDGQIDGTKAHAVERLFGLLCHDSKMSIDEI